MNRYLVIGDKKLRLGTAKYYLFKEFIKGKYPLELLNEYAEGYGSKRSKKVYRKVKKETIYRYFEEFKSLMDELVFKYRRELRKMYTDFVKEIGKSKGNKKLIEKAERRYRSILDTLENAYENNRWNSIIHFRGVDLFKDDLESLKSYGRY